MLPGLPFLRLCVIISVMGELFPCFSFAFVFFADYTLNNKESRHLECCWLIYWYWVLSKTGFATIHEVFTKDQETVETEKVKAHGRQLESK